MLTSFPALEQAATCAKKCSDTNGCVAFELYLARAAPACYIFLEHMEQPFTPCTGCMTCVRHVLNSEG
jgi:hypothetical protein